jgi:ribosomal-protein-alanine N-acetyltransferase
MTIRPLTPFDAEMMAELEKSCFSLPWSLQSVRSELENPIGLYLGAFIEGRLAGYAGMQLILDEGYITNIAAAPALRRLGIAGRLMAGLMAVARERGLSFVTLEVRKSNIPAQNLYIKHGFVAVGTRKNYYDEPKEDAVIMTRQFTGDKSG